MDHHVGSVPGVPPRVRPLKACDQCRYKRRKCNHSRDAKRCERCERLGWCCTYETKSNVTREHKYVTHLEQKVKKLEDEIALVRLAGRNDDHAGNAVKPSSARVSLPSPDAVTPPKMQDSPAPDIEYLTPESLDEVAVSPKPSPSSGTTRCLNSVPFDASDQEAAWYSTCSGMETLRRLRVQMDTLAELGTASHDPGGYIIAHALDRSIILELMKTNTLPQVFRPAKPPLLRHIDIAFSEVFSSWPIVSRAQVDDIVLRLYNPATFHCPNVREDELALLYGILALGERLEWAKIPVVDAEFDGHPLKGMELVKAALGLVQPSECNGSIASLHTIMCLALYFITASAHMLAHSYVSSAIHAATSMQVYELDTSCQRASSSTPVDKTTYQTLRALDIYLSSFLGYPPSELVCSASTETSLLSRIKCPLSESESAAFYAEAHSSLLDVLGEIQRKMYEIENAGSEAPPRVAIEGLITEMGKRFDEWYKTALTLLEPTPQLTSIQSFRPRLSLQYAYACIRMISYAPFLHHVLQATSNAVEKKQYLAGSLCIMAAIQASRIAQLMEAHSMLNNYCTLLYNGPILAASILLTVQLGPGDCPAIDDARAASWSAEQTLNQLAMRDAAVAACAESLKPLYRVAAARAKARPLLPPPCLCH